MSNRGFSSASLALTDSVTHGTTAKIAELNRGREPGDRVVDLSIGTLDLPADPRIDKGVTEFIREKADTIHAFAPVKGFPFLRASLAAKITRMHGVAVNPDTEILVTPGGIKGALTIVFHTFLDPGDEVLVPIPNWPHYADMIHLHRGVPKFIKPEEASAGLSLAALEAAITDKTKMVVLGDAINPTGKVYTTEELRGFALAIAKHNVKRAAASKAPILVLFDCPYESHVLGARATTFAAIDVDVPGHGKYALSQVTATVTGPGKTYGMHGDRIGYLWACAETIEMAARVQVNTNSFASTYGQVATHIAVQADMDEVALSRAKHARNNLEHVFTRLSGGKARLRIARPDGGYFLWVDFSAYAPRYAKLGFTQADAFLLQEARVAAINGSFFAPDIDGMSQYVRLNCGRTLAILEEACSRIESALTKLGE